MSTGDIYTYLRGERAGVNGRVHQLACTHKLVCTQKHTCTHSTGIQPLTELTLRRLPLRKTAPPTSRMEEEEVVVDVA